MGVKGLTLLGIATSSLLVYLCISSNKDRLYAKILAKQGETNTTKKVTKIKKKILADTPLPAKKSIVATADPYFRYTHTLLDVNLSKKQKDSLTKEIDKITILDDNLSKNISFDERVKEFNDISYLEELIVASKKDKVKNFALTLKGTKVSVSGVLDSDAKLKDFKEILKKLDDKKYDIENNLEVVEAKKEVKIEKPVEKIIDKSKEKETSEEKAVQKVVVEEVIENQAKAVVSKDTQVNKKIEKKPKTKVVTEKKKKKEVTKKVEKKVIKPKIKKKPTHVKKVSKDPKAEDLFVVTDKIDKYEANERISNLLLVEPLEFDLNGGVLSAQNKTTLKKIAGIIKDIEGNAKVVINVYTLKGEEATYNKVMSQKIANKIKNFLVRNGVNSYKIVANGKGYIDPIADPYDSINNRVEIEIE